MIINKKKVKQILKESGKQCSKEYLERLDYKVNDLIQRSIINAKHFKRLKEGELM